MIRGIQPNIQMSQGGYDIIVNSLQQGLQREQDLMQFQEHWLKPSEHGGGGHGTVAGMMDEFNKAHPMEAYASRVLPLPMPAKPADAKPNVIYRNSKGETAIWTGTEFQPTAPQ
jgi:hypothetical protein